MPPSSARLELGRRLMLIVIAAGLSSGCVAELLEKKRPRKGPVPEVGYIESGGGELRYSTEGWGLVVAARRGSALRRMRRVCKGLDARVISDVTRQDVDTPYSTEEMSVNLAKGLNHYNVAPYRHIVFECIPKEKKSL